MQTSISLNFLASFSDFFFFFEFSLSFSPSQKTLHFIESVNVSGRARGSLLLVDQGVRGFPWKASFGNIYIQAFEF